MKPATRELRADNDHLEISPAHDRTRIHEQVSSAIALPARRVFEVRMNDCGWQVVDAAGASLSAPVASREGAVAEGLRHAALNQPSRLIIRRPNGSTHEERVFGQQPGWRRRSVPR